VVTNRRVTETLSLNSGLERRTSAAERGQVLRHELGGEPRDRVPIREHGERGRECSARARSNEAVLVLSCAIDHGADECIGGGIGVALTADAYDARAFERHGACDAGREHDITCDAIALRNDEHPCGVLAQGRQR
jgi:hypothetical protein